MKTDVIKTAVKENKKNKMAVLCRKVKENIKNFWQDEDGMGVVEIVLIIVVKESENRQRMNHCDTDSEHRKTR